MACLSGSGVGRRGSDWPSQGRRYTRYVSIDLAQVAVHFVRRRDHVRRGTDGLKTRQPAAFATEPVVNTKNDSGERCSATECFAFVPV